MASVRQGIYLLDNPPARPQFNEGRRDPVRPVIVVHTAESGTDLEGADPKAENVASFIRGRADAGSYHLLGDTDSIVQMVRFGDECYADRTGSNRWAIHISLAMNAADWPTLPPARRSALLDTAAQMATIAANWLVARGLPLPAPVLLTKAETDNPLASGFTSHARRDPERREDPGTGFPWDEFFARYVSLTGGETPMASGRMTWEELQRMLASAGVYTGAIDGDPWTKTRAAVAELVVRAEAVNDLRASVAALTEHAASLGHSRADDLRVARQQGADEALVEVRSAAQRLLAVLAPGIV